MAQVTRHRSAPRRSRRRAAAAESRRRRRFRKTSTMFDEHEGSRRPDEAGPGHAGEAAGRAGASSAETGGRGPSGGGMVKVTLKGAGELTRVDIDESLMEPGEGEIVADLVVAAHADAERKLEDARRRRDADGLPTAAGPARRHAAGHSGSLPHSASASGSWPPAAGPEIERLIALLGQAAGPGAALGPARGAGAARSARDQLLHAAGRGAGRGRGAGEGLLDLRLARHPRPLRDLRRPRAATAR